MCNDFLLWVEKLEFPLDLLAIVFITFNFVVLCGAFVFIVSFLPLTSLLGLAVSALISGWVLLIVSFKESKRNED